VGEVSFINKQLLSFVLIEIIVMMPCLALAQPLDKIDAELRMVLERSAPSELIGIIIVFQDRPTEDQLNTLKTIHKMEITHVYRIINGVAGRVPAGEIPKIAKYEWVKEIWLDRKVYVTSSKTVETSELIGTFQEENDKLRQTISNFNQEINELQGQLRAQQSQILQLETNLKIYSVITFIVGLIVGMVAITLIRKGIKTH
jgi:hypothetical protein